jgi:Zn-dependent protease with chaperone function
VRWARRYHEEPGSAWQNLQNIVTTWCIFMPTLILFAVMTINLPPHWNVRAVLTIAAAVFAYFWIQFGGWVRIARFLRLLIPADPKLVDAVKELAREWECPAPAVWMLRWRKANALAFPFSKAIAVTGKLDAILSPEEMKAVLEHEMAHLHEDRVTRLMRLLIPLLLLPVFTLPLWWTDDNWTAFAACYAFLIVGLILLRKRARRMEERADSFGGKAVEDARVYPQALAKLYESNHVPAVMPGKRMVHPHLYDRLLSTGITPDYPRPKPPSRWGILAALFTVVINVLYLATIWLLLF